MSEQWQAGQAVVVLVGSACGHHAGAIDPAILQRLQGRYGVVMDSAQMTAWGGPTVDPEHTVGVRFVKPFEGLGVCVRGGWFRPDECFERWEPAP